MRTLDEIKESKRVVICSVGSDGGAGMISLPTWRGSVIWSFGAGWEHVSVSPEHKRVTPSWDDMCKIKALFFRENETAIQIHPPKEEYVNNMPNCLHLWRCTYREMVLPPSCLVGVKKGQSKYELMEEIKKAYEIAGEKFEG